MKKFGGALLGIGLLALIFFQEVRLAALGIVGGIFFFLLGLVLDPMRNAKKARDAAEASVNGLVRQLDTIRLDEGEVRHMPALQAKMQINGKGWSPIAVLVTDRRLIVQPLDTSSATEQRFDIARNAMDDIRLELGVVSSSLSLKHQGTSFKFGSLSEGNAKKLMSVIGKRSEQAPA